MFRLPKTSNQSPAKKIIGNSQKSHETCKYSHRKCNFVCLENYEYCLKHILEDKSAPYKPCPFLYTISGKKCGKPAIRLERKDTWFCLEHSRKAHVLRQKSLNRPAPPQTQESLLASLGHYARAEQSSGRNEEIETEDAASKKNSTHAVNPFVEVNAAQVNARSSQVLDYASESDSDVEAAMLDSVWRAQDHESSDAESVDSQAEDPLKHAGVYTAEEVTVVIKDKMLRLQSLYIDQFRRLNHLLKERRRKYLHAIKKEKETMCSIHDQEKTSTKEQKLYQKLKVLNHFHKYYGEEAILHKKSLERRAQVTEGTLVRTSPKGKCAFTEGGVKCGAKTLPGTKYCRKHILEDTQQVLFRACGFKRDDHTCKEPTLNVFENATCVYHITLPAQPHNTLDMSDPKKEIKVEMETERNSQEEALVKTSLLPVDTPELLTQDDLKPVELIPELKPEPMSSLITQLETVSPLPEPAAPIACVDTPKVENVDMTTLEPTSILKEISDEKMDIDKEVLDPVNTEPSTHETATDDLVMVDMMTDVGVVEEVLDSEIKLPHEESMQLDSQNDNLGNGS